MKNKYSLQYFLRKPWSFVLIKNGKIVFRSKAERLQPLILCMKNKKREMRKSVVFDKVVGRAAAHLLAHARVAEIWTPTVSRDAKKILAESKIKLDFKKETANIRNRKGDDLCPMEKMSQKMGGGIVKFLLKENKQ